MKTLIKQIRTYLNLSQAELANQLNVSFATVNRWENGRSVPNRLAQSMLFDFCKEKSVPVYEMTLQKIAEAAASISLEPGRILLYHGSKAGIEGRIEPKSRAQCDFGIGFYMGTEPSQALTLICDYEKSKFYIISIGTDILAHLEVPADIDWAMLVAYHRGRMEKIKGTSFYNKNDHTSLRVGLSEQRGIITSAYLTLRNESDCFERYLYYQLHAFDICKGFYGMGAGVRQGLNWDGIKMLKIVRPTVAEQHRIAAFLDRKCAEIDAVIERTKATIEEYKKLKQAIITEAVTKGIRGNRPMKNSGIEWIGEIPEGWEVKVAFQLFQQVKCKNEGTIEQNLLSLSYGRIKRKRIDTVGGLLPESFDGYNIIEANDIVLRLTDLQNDQTSLRVGLSHERGIVTSAYLTLRNQSDNLALYLYYYLHTFDVCKGFYGMGAGVRQGLNWDGLKLLKIVLPLRLCTILLQPVLLYCYVGYMMKIHIL